MSEILVDNLTGKTSAGDITVTSEGGAATQSLQQGLAKAWINFDGSGTVAIRDNFNAASLTDNGSGNYTVGFSNSLASANYTGVITGAVTDTGMTANSSTFSCRDFTTSSMRGTGGGTSNNHVDMPRMCIVIHGDLA